MEVYTTFCDLYRNGTMITLYNGTAFDQTISNKTMSRWRLSSD